MNPKEGNSTFLTLCTNVKSPTDPDASLTPNGLKLHCKQEAETLAANTELKFSLPVTF